MSKKVRHIVLITLKPEVTESEKHEVISKLDALGQQTSGLLEWRVAESLDTRKGTVIVENGLFQDQSAFDAFKNSALHQSTGAFLKDKADWIIADYVT